MRWRLLSDPPGSGPWNMGVDEALLASATREGVATLRLYAWRGPWLSLGYGQPPDAVCLDACRRAGVGVVRRATGGRAVLHGQDLTYALAAPEAVLPPGLGPCYALVAEALRAALATVGVRAERSPGAPGRDPEALDCFEAPAGDELCSGGLKLVGSAQRRAGGAVLQHGSIRIAPDPGSARLATGLRGRGATSLQELGAPVSPERLRAACIASLGAALGARLWPSELAPEERSWAERRQIGHSSDPLARPQSPIRPSQGAYPPTDT